MSAEPQRPRGRRLLAGSLVLSATGIGLLAWWLLSDPRPWFVLGAGVVCAFAGVAVGARARRATSASDATLDEAAKRRGNG